MKLLLYDVMKEPKPISAKEQTYIDVYVATRDRAKAGIAAGYSPKTAGTIGWTLEKSKPHIRQAIDDAIAKLEATAEQNAGVNLEYVLRRLRELAERCMQAEPVRDKDGNPTGEWRFDSTGANGALKALLQHFQQQADRQAGSVPATFNLFMAGVNPQVLVQAQKVAVEQTEDDD